MVKSGGFIVGIAAALDLPEPTISGAFRILRESGLMTSGARGVNAPDMTDLDAARMTIAMLVNERPAYSESGVRDFGQLICTDFRPASEDIDQVSEEIREDFDRSSREFTLADRGLSECHTLEQAVAELIRMYGDDRQCGYWVRSQIDLGERGTFDPNATIEVVAGSLSARISMQGNVYRYSDPLVDPNTWGEDESPEGIAGDMDAEDAHNLKLSRYSTAIRSVRSINTIQLLALAKVLREAAA
ncbi:hypothetical protein [Pararhizobium mangrovi]|uniref:Uncharacterized protein n=1 Tax=Pararhizobium mangrovi TaxID=2590452 RepID=A0A506UHF0_9HYPH|nr:hypothetical protein [Pararhizobium mangrovi]TPW32745.1 hypothetical protein FJU11_00525 [Pararhizobium mangrovi]